MYFTRAFAMSSLFLCSIWLSACSAPEHQKEPTQSTTHATQDSSPNSQAQPHVNTPVTITRLGYFNVEKDLFLAQFDSKTDVDDIHSIAGVATVLTDKRFASVRYHAVAGAYGVQGGLYVPANELFNAAFGKNWSDAHNNFQQALMEVSQLARNTLTQGGDIWIAEAGQSDFSAALIKNIKASHPTIDTTKRVHIVQHSTWNEESAAPAKLRYVKRHSDYRKIPDGNATGNGSPGLRTEKTVAINKIVTNKKTNQLWDMAITIANNYNGKDDRYHNGAIAKGGLDFSDVTETCWIFGFQELNDVNDFFSEFTKR